MPIVIQKKIDPHTSLGIWKNEEDIAFFVDRLSLSVEELDHATNLKPHRIREWLSSRYLCKLLTGKSDYIRIVKDVHGKPFIEHSEKNISISHSNDMAAVIISDKTVGIDIQKHVEKIYRIKHKFISEEELEDIDKVNLLDAYHIFWGAKEAMYKAYGKKEVDFKKHMHLYPFKCFNSDLEIKGYLRKNDTDMNFDIYTRKADDYHLIYSILES